jgi:hypothetical protein
MGAALAVVDGREDLRTMAHDALDKWLDQMEAGDSKAPTLREISERFMATRLDLLSACLETVIRQQYAAELQQTEAVCGCGRRLAATAAGCQGDVDAARLRHPEPPLLLL